MTRCSHSEMHYLQKKPDLAKGPACCSLDLNLFNPLTISDQTHLTGFVWPLPVPIIVPNQRSGC